MSCRDCLVENAPTTVWTAPTTTTAPSAKRGFAWLLAPVMPVQITAWSAVWLMGPNSAVTARLTTVSRKQHPQLVMPVPPTANLVTLTDVNGVRMATQSTLTEDVQPAPAVAVLAPTMQGMRGLNVSPSRVILALSRIRQTAAVMPATPTAEADFVPMETASHVARVMLGSLSWEPPVLLARVIAVCALIRVPAPAAMKATDSTLLPASVTLVATSTV